VMVISRLVWAAFGKFLWKYGKEPGTRRKFHLIIDTSYRNRPCVRHFSRFMIFNFSRRISSDRNGTEKKSFWACARASKCHVSRKFSVLFWLGDHGWHWLIRIRPSCHTIFSFLRAWEEILGKSVWREVRLRMSFEGGVVEWCVVVEVKWRRATINSETGHARSLPYITGCP